MARILDDGNRGVDGTGYTSLTDGLVNSNQVMNALGDSFDIKGLTSEIVDTQNQVLSGAVNNIATVTNANLVNNTGTYQMPNTSSVSEVSSLLGQTGDLAVQTYMDGANLYLDSLANIYSTASDFASLQLEAEKFDAQQELAWANQALAEEQFDLEVATFEESKRHSSAVRSATAQAKANAKAEQQSRVKSIYDTLLGGSDSSDGSIGNLFGFDINTHENEDMSYAEEAERIYNEVIGGSNALSDETKMEYYENWLTATGGVNRPYSNDEIRKQFLGE